MAYELSSEDIENELGNQGTAGQYNLSAQDIDELENEAAQPKSLHDVIFQGLRPQSIKDIPGELSNIGRGTLAGALKGAQGIGEFEAKGVRPIANYLGIPVAQSMQQSLGSSGVTGINKLYTPEVAATPEGRISYAGGQAIPYATMPLGEGGMLMKALRSGATTEALSPAFNPDVPISEAYIQGLAPAGIAGSIAGAFGAPKALGNLLKMGGKATPEQFAANVRAVGEKPVGIGKLSASPMVAGAEDNFLTNLPYAGMAQKDIQVGHMIDQDVSDVLGELNVVPGDKPRYKLTGNPVSPVEPVPSDTSVQKISSNLADNFEKNQELKTKLYNERNKIAENIGAEAVPTLRQQVANEELEKIAKQKSRKGFIDVSSDTLKELKAAANGKNIPFSEINFDKNSYRQKAAQAKSVINTREEKIFDRLGAATDKDMRNSLAEINNPELNRAQYVADKHYETKIAPILNNNKLRAHARRDAPRDQVISDFVKTGSYDQPEQVHAVLQNLDEPHRKQFAHEFLTRGLKELDGTQAVRGDSVLSLYGRLGNETKRLMFTPNQIQKLDRAFRTRKLMGASIDQMSNPKTGYTHAKMLVGGGAGTLAAALGHTLAAHGINPALAYSGGVGAVGGLGKLLTNYLTSPLSRKVYQKGLNLSAIPSQQSIPATSIANLLSQQNQNGAQQ